jgi:hypothetical protein
MGHSNFKLENLKLENPDENSNVWNIKLKPGEKVLRKMFVAKENESVSYSVSMSYYMKKTKDNFIPIQKDNKSEFEPLDISPDAILDKISQLNLKNFF